MQKITFVLNMNNKTYTSAKPFVKWVGEKTQLLEDIKHALPTDFSQKKDIVLCKPFSLISFYYEAI